MTTKLVPVEPLTDEYIDKLLMTHIPGGSHARDWFLPHDSDKARANIRDVVRRILTADLVLSAAPSVSDAAPGMPSELELICGCTVMERYSGHRVDCYVPQVCEYIKSVRAFCLADRSRTVERVIAACIKQLDDAFLCPEDVEYDNGLERQDKQGTAFNRGVLGAIRALQGIDRSQFNAPKEDK